MAEPQPAQISTSKAASQDESTNEKLRSSFYDGNVQDVSSEARGLLEGYAGYSRDELLPCVMRLRDDAFAKYPYASIGSMRFLLYNLPRIPCHGRVVESLKQGATFVDAGCCFGQELRYLIHTEGIPSSQLYGFDLESTFIDLGFQLFRDRDSLSAQFVQADVLEDQDLLDWNGKFDVIFCSSFLHVWPWDEMLKAAKRLVQLSSQKAGAMICGKQLASKVAGHYPLPTAYGRNYRHNEQSMRDFWRQVGEETDTKWDIDAGLYSLDLVGKNPMGSWSEPNEAMIWFCVTKL